MADDPRYARAVEIIRTLQRSGFQAFLAGGYVRNLILKRPPKDYDIATNAIPEVIERFFPRTIPVGRAFGVMIVLVDGHEFEVATFRADGPYLDGRHPSRVTFSDYMTDVFRRDFTVNGMLYDPVRDKIIDLVGGRTDLEARVIRAIGDPRLRFEEDRLRMLRAVRFACELGFEIEARTEREIRALAPRIVEISAERIRDELRKILVSPLRHVGMDLLAELGLLKYVLPEAAAMRGVPQPPEFHPEGDVWIHTLIALKKLENPTFEVALATLLHDIGKPPTLQVADRIRFNQHEFVGGRMTAGVARRLRCSREETERVTWIVEKHMMFKDVPKMKESTLKRFLSHPFYPDLERVFRADKGAGDADPEIARFLDGKKAAYADIPLRPEPFLRGADLIALGREPGPDFGRILREAEDAQLDGRLTSREAALEWLRERIRTGTPAESGPAGGPEVDPGSGKD